MHAPSADASFSACLRRDSRWLLPGMLALLVLLAAPFIFAWAHTPAEMRFGGLLANPLDGNTYLAKMGQGRAGAWAFHLPYTSEPHAPAPIYIYYLALGHLAGLTGLSLPLVFHAARLLNSVLFMLAGYLLIWALRPAAERRLAWLLTFAGSGLGWLAALFGWITPDLNVPEAIPFYSMYTNPHFPLAMAAMLTLLAAIMKPFPPDTRRIPSWRLIGAAGSALVLAFTKPFAFAIIAIVILAVLSVRWQRHDRFPLRELLVSLLAAGVALPYCIVLLRIFVTNPAMTAWSALDITLSPPPWDYLIAYGVLLPFAILGARRALCNREEIGIILVLWAILNLLLPYVPYNLQRRLIMGEHFPLAMLAAKELLEGPWNRQGTPAAGRWPRLIVALATLSNLFLLSMGALAAAKLDPTLYLLPGEPAAADWLASQPASGAILALPRTSIFLPTWTGRPVYYGHPMETIDAPKKQAQVKALFTGQRDASPRAELLARPDLSTLWVGPYERGLAAPSFLESLAELSVLYDAGGVTLYRLPAP